MENKINKIKTLILNNKEGLTLDFNGIKQNNKSGYYVAITDNKTTLNLIDKSIKNLINLSGFFSNMKNIFIGSWIDEESGFLYLDLSLYIEDKETAINTAKQFNQKAIFDNQNLNSIYV